MTPMPRELHEYDAVSMFCKRCGRSAGRTIRTGVLCSVTENVSGISHILAKRKGTWVIEHLETLNGSAA
jgi:hypothetical protein